MHNTRTDQEELIHWYIFKVFPHNAEDQSGRVFTWNGEKLAGTGQQSFNSRYPHYGTGKERFMLIKMEQETHTKPDESTAWEWWRENHYHQQNNNL